MTDKPALIAKRTELVQRLTHPLSPSDRVRIQGELSVVNAKIKAINTTEAAQLKAIADQRRVGGLAEFHANRQRALENAGVTAPAEADDDPAQTGAIDTWFVTVLQDSGVAAHCSRKGIDYGDVPAKWLVILQRLRAGLHAAARGQELPEADAEPEIKPKSKPKKR